VAYTEKSIQCVDCGANFPFSVQDQEFFAQKGYTNEPKRCPACRQVRKTERGGGAAGGSAAEAGASPSALPVPSAARRQSCHSSPARAGRSIAASALPSSSLGSFKQAKILICQQV
jgi:hypothetical protein